jgi:hypothetical protein
MDRTSCSAVFRHTLQARATAGLDSLCARRRRTSTVGAEESLQAWSNKRKHRSKKESGLHS